MAVIAIVASGDLASPTVALPNGGGTPFAVEVTSGAATSVALQFTSAGIDATSAQFLPLARGDGSGGLHTAYSGTAGAWCGPIAPVTPWVRVLVGTAVAASPRSYQI